MSYILDALKKLEKEKRRGIIPGLAEQDSIVYHSHKRSYMPFILVPLFLAAAGVTWWLLPLLSRHSLTAEKPTMPAAHLQEPPAETKPPATPVLTAAVETPKNVQTTDIRISAPEIRKEEPLSALPKPGAEPVKALAQPAETKQGDKQELRQAKSLQQAPRPETAAEKVEKKKLYKFSELPLSVRESLSKFFTVTAFMYSNTPSERKVRINDHMMKEGQIIDPGIRIEEILPEGVILTYNNFRFLVTTQ